jgi:hypothetical protein
MSRPLRRVELSWIKYNSGRKMRKKNQNILTSIFMRVLLMEKIQE